MNKLLATLLKYKLLIILCLVAFFILSCHCVKSLDILHLNNKKDEKEEFKNK